MSPRIAGNNPGYTFRLVSHDGVVQEDGFDLPSVTTIIKDTLGVPAGAMSWYGFRLGITGMAELLADEKAAVEALDNPTPEYLEKMLKQREVNPNIAVSKAGDRGSAAHQILEYLADGEYDKAQMAAADEEKYQGTKYGSAVIAWWIESGIDRDGLTTYSERRVWSLKHGYAGSLDLAIADPGDNPHSMPVEICDLKTHKPASGFTKPGQGPAYISDLIQVSAYANAWNEMGLPGRAYGGRIIIARENGQWLEDTRSVPFELFQDLVEVYRRKHEFEGGGK